MKFNSQICTTKAQSERLLALGLKKETADMSILSNQFCQDSIRYSLTPYSEINQVFDAFPAWSLHRLIEILNVWRLDFNFHEFVNAYEYVISYFEVQVKDGYINKKYLEE